MKKRLFSIILAYIVMNIFFAVSYCVTKQDIINYVDSQNVCGDVSLFNTYKSTFTRMLKQKSLTEKELDSIYSYLTKAVNLLNNKGVCRLADLNKLTESEKSTIYSSLTSGAAIISNAPSVGMSEGVTQDNNSKDESIKVDSAQSSNKIDTSKDTKTNVTINTKDNTMDIYEDGVLIDKVSMSAPKMTYTGPSISFIFTYVVCFLICILSILVYFIIYNKKETKYIILKNILLSFAICALSIFVIAITFGDEMLKIKSMINLISIENDLEKEFAVELNDDKSIKRYPSYGYNYGTLEIEELNISNKIYFGDTENILSLGIGHATSSSMPAEGEVVIYSGHNNSNALNNLKNISAGMEIVVDTTYAECTYIVKDIKILNDTEFNKLNKIDNKETLILYTCYPFNTYIYSNQRFVVYSTIKEINWK